MEKNIFGILCFVISRKAKKIVQCMEGCCHWCVKSGLRSFLLGITHWTMLHSWVDQLKLIAIKTLIKNNQSYTTAGIVDKLKIFKSSVEKHLHQLGYVNRFDVWIPHKLNEKTLAIFPHEIPYLNIAKMFCFKDRLW